MTSTRESRDTAGAMGSDGAHGVPSDPAPAAGRRREKPARVWLHEVEVEVLALRGELEDLVARHPASRANGQVDDVSGTARSVRALLARAESAARGVDPHRRRLVSWWSGDGVESAFRSLHRAEAEIARLYDDDEADAAAPEAAARLRSTVGGDDPRLELGRELGKLTGRAKSAALSKMIQIGHEAKDQQYSKVRRFRNIVVCAAVLIAVFMALFGVIVSRHPAAVPFCFEAQSTGVPLHQVCPTREWSVSSGADVWIVILLGLLGGSLAAAVSIRNIRGAPTPYNLATALALLKVPAGALTAVGALILIGGDAIPGLSNLDSQEQILSYALVFGYGQQLLTGMIDRRAADIVAGVHVKAHDGPQRTPPPGHA